MKHCRVAIIGAGTAGLSARREVAKETHDYVLIDDGVLGTTCARVGCMPSKVLIQVANDFHRRGNFNAEGIRGGDALSVDSAAVMTHVRSLRDRFVRGVLGGMASWREEHFTAKRARFVGDHVLDLGDEQIEADRVIIATGSSPILPGPWAPFRHRLIDTNAFFELSTLPRRVAVVGLGVIGLELGQALHRLGVEVVAVSLDKAYGGLSDPTLQSYAHDRFSSEFPVHLSGVSKLHEEGEDLVLTLEDGTTLAVDQALLSVGRRPNVAGLGLEELGVPFERGLPVFDPTTFRVEGKDWYFVGDVNGTRPLLHEAADEGRIAGHNAVHDKDQCFRRRTAMSVTFSAPNIANVGRSHRELSAEGVRFVTGEASYEGQGRAIVKGEEGGLLHVYADPKTGEVLGAELLAPGGEHLAHLLAWAIAAGLGVRQALSLPFYHPVLEEGLRTALRDAAEKLEDSPPPLEVLRCADPPVGVRA